MNPSQPKPTTYGNLVNPNYKDLQYLEFVNKASI